MARSGSPGSRLFELIACLELGPNAYYHLEAVGQHPRVSRIWIIRSRPIMRGTVRNGDYVLVRANSRPSRFLKMLWNGMRLGRSREVIAYISFNPIPYGIIQLLPAMLYGKPIHFGFVGSDWYRHVRSRYGFLLRPFLQRASFITATGTSMRNEMIAYGLDPKKIAILPHGIDVESFPPLDPAAATNACVYVGSLISLKRVDLILDAFASVLDSRPTARLCIVGDGPERTNLERQAVALDIRHAVTFAGHVRDIRPYLAKSKLILVASDREGLPFALIEGMVSGLVPISTPVGTITDWIEDGENGLLFPAGDAKALAQSICRLLDDPELYQRLRANALEIRSAFSLDNATAVWDRWLSTLVSGGSEERSL